VRAKVLRGEPELRHAFEAAILGAFCKQYKQLFAAATHFYRETFAAEPRLAEDPVRRTATWRRSATTGTRRRAGT
jgi:hypothetical protein